MKNNVDVSIRQKLSLRQLLVVILVLGSFGFAVMMGILTTRQPHAADIISRTAHTASKNVLLVAGEDYEANALYVKFAESTGIETAEAARPRLDAVRTAHSGLPEFAINDVRSVFRAGQGDPNTEAKRKYGLQRIFRVVIDGASDIPSLATALASDQMFEYVTPAFLLKPLGTPNDPLFPNQWHHQNAEDHDIDTPAAWDVTTGSPSVIIADPDIGLDWRHDDLRDNLWQNLGEDADHDGHVIELVEEQWQFDPGDVNGLDDDGYGGPMISSDQERRSRNITRTAPIRPGMRLRLAIIPLA